MLLVLSVGHVLKPKLVVVRVGLVAKFVIDEVYNGLFFLSCL